MKTGKHPSRSRRIIGDILLALVILLTADVVIVMLHKINTVVLKADYREIFYYELFLCAMLLLFALDIRFNLFTRSRHKILRIVGWVPRALVVLFSLVIVFFCGKVIGGSVINTADRADHAIVLGWRWKTENPRQICWQG